MAFDLQFYIGKGGVGKSTSAALAAVALAQQGCETLLVSLDPAHNLGDIFQADLSGKRRRILPRLSVLEVDVDLWVKRCLKETTAAIKRSYSYESAFNLERHFDVLQLSPGIEEYALLMAFEDILHSSEGTHTIIFDMAPTALTLRFFFLPFITLVWLESLMNLRQEIFAKKQIISLITVGRRQIEQDKVKSKLASMIEKYQRLKTHFALNGSRINLVMNEDRLSFAEAFRIRAKLDRIGMRIDTIVVNKALDTVVPKDVQTAFDSQRFRLLPLAASNLTGLAALRAYIRENRSRFERPSFQETS